MHRGGYKTHILLWETLYIYIDSSQQNRHYLVLYYENSSVRIEVWKDYYVKVHLPERVAERKPTWWR